jgi:hypothetical protein
MSHFSSSVFSNKSIRRERARDQEVEKSESTVGNSSRPCLFISHCLQTTPTTDYLLGFIIFYTIGKFDINQYKIKRLELRNLINLIK